MDRPTRKPNRGRGRPGASARAAVRNQRARVATSSWAARLAYLAISVGLGLAVSIYSGWPWWAGLLGGGLVWAAVLGSFLSAELLPMLITLALSLPSLYVTSVFLTTLDAAGKGWNALAYGSTVLGNVIYLLTILAGAVWLSVRASRGRAWVTVLLSVVALMFVAPALTGAFPSLPGLFWATVVVSSVLALRCGGWAWIAGAFAVTALRFRFRGDKELETLSSDAVLSDWQSRSEAEERSAAILEQLSQDWHVFHDMDFTKPHLRLPHVLIGPGGVFVMASVLPEGDLEEDPVTGLQLPGVPLGVVADTLISARVSLAKVLKVRPDAVSMVVVVAGERLSGPRSMAVFGPTDGSVPRAQIRLIPSSSLISELDNGIATMSPVTVKVLAHRANMRLRPASTPTPRRVSAAQASSTVRSIDADGWISLPDEPAAVGLRDGDLVDIVTSGGLLRDLRVVGAPYRDQFDRLVIGLCVDEEWHSAAAQSRKPLTYPYPVSAVVPATL